MTDRALDLDLVSRAATELRSGIPRTEIPTIIALLQIGDSTPPKIPAVLLYLFSEEVGESAAPRAGAYQRATARLAVLHIIPAINTKRNSGDSALDPMAVLTGRTRAMLNGWRWTERPRNSDVLQLRGGRLMQIEDGRALWQDEYVTSWRIAQATQEGG